jgi:hypothetical protein
MSRPEESPTDSSGHPVLKAVGVTLSLTAVPLAVGGAYAMGTPDGVLRILGVPVGEAALVLTALTFGFCGLALVAWLEWETE